MCRTAIASDAGGVVLPCVGYVSVHVFGGGVGVGVVWVLVHGLREGCWCLIDVIRELCNLMCVCVTNISLK